MSERREFWRFIGLFSGVAFFVIAMLKAAFFDARASGWMLTSDPANFLLLACFWMLVAIYAKVSR